MQGKGSAFLQVGDQPGVRYGQTSQRLGRAGGSAEYLEKRGVAEVLVQALPDDVPPPPTRFRYSTLRGRSWRRC